VAVGRSPEYEDESRGKRHMESTLQVLARERAGKGRPRREKQSGLQKRQNGEKNSKSSRSNSQAGGKKERSGTNIDEKN